MKNSKTPRQYILPVTIVLCFLVCGSAVSLFGQPFERIALKRFYNVNQITSFQHPTILNPRSVAFDGTNIWVANSSTGAPGGGSVTVFRASDGMFMCAAAIGGAPQGITYDGAFMWVADFSGNTVTAIQANSCDPDSADTLLNPVVMPAITVGNQPWGIAFDGANLWVSNFGSDTLSKIPINNGAVSGSIGTITLPAGSKPQGLAFDGINVWVANNGLGSIMAFNATTNALSCKQSPNGGPTALSYDGQNGMWIAFVANGSGIDKMTFTPTVPGSCGPPTFIPLGSKFNVPATDILFDGLDVWVSHVDGQVVKFQPTPFPRGLVLAAFTVQSGGVFGLAFDGANIWAASINGGFLNNGLVQKL